MGVNNDESIQHALRPAMESSCTCTCSSSPFLSILISQFAIQRKKFYRMKIVALTIVTIAFFAFFRICLVPLVNGFLEEGGERIVVKRPENLGIDQRLMFGRNASTTRKLLFDPGIDRIGDACTAEDVAIFQGETGPLPDGIPSFMVQIINLCMAGCPISEIHVACGWFASTKLINPRIFKRVKFNDCIVNDNLPLKEGESVVFEYANSFQYPMEVSSVNLCCT